MHIAYIDAQNIHKGTQQLGRTIDWSKLKNYLEVKYQISEIQIFFGYVPQYRKLYMFLEGIGYTLVFKEVSVTKTGDVKGNVDIDIAVKAMNDIIDKRITCAYLLTTDVDYNTLIYEFRRRHLRGKLIVTSFAYTSKYLRKASGAFIQPLSDIRHLVELTKLSGINKKGPA